MQRRESIHWLCAIVSGFISWASARAEAPPFYPDKAKLLIFKDTQGNEHPVQSIADWEQRRAHILANMQLVMGPLPDAARKVPLDVQETEVVTIGSYKRIKLTYAAAKDDRVPAYLFVPLAPRGKLPAVLCLHPTSKEFGKGVPAGFGPKEDRHYAVHLAERGYVALAPDYINSGEYKGDPYQRGYASATMLGIWNHMRAVDVLQARPEVDGDRIGVIGHSLGGHNSMFVAAFDPRIKCIVSNCGFCSFPRYMKGDLKGWTHDGYMPRMRTLFDSKPEKMPFDFTEIVGVLAPRPFLASAPVKDHNFDVQGVKDCITAARPVYNLYGAGDKLAANYPDCDHNFPTDVRKVAYEWLDKWLKVR